MPVPLDLYCEGAREPVRVEIEERPGSVLVAVLVWDSGDRMDVSAGSWWWPELSVEDAWEAVALDTSRSWEHRRTAIWALVNWREERVRESQRWDD